MTLLGAACCVSGPTTFLLGSANADAENARASTTLAQGIDQPLRRLSLFTVVMRKVCAFSLRTAREKKCNDRSLQDKEATVSDIVNTADWQLANARHQS